MSTKRARTIRTGITRQVVVWFCVGVIVLGALAGGIAVIEAGANSAPVATAGGAL